MHRLIKIRIIRDFEHLEEQMRRGFDTLLEAYKTPVSFRPAADFYETAQGLVLRLELAGSGRGGRFPHPDGARTAWCGAGGGRQRPKASGASSIWRWPSAFLNGASRCP